ncbi:MAG: bifunctional UDP-N-acetylglucosamine diphosphorylase/glucosamine-1-phosphate N-acetyltransferase GlmU, partial [Pseudomonadota bacterium]
TRMRSDTPKVMHKVAGREMVAHVIAAARGAGVGEVALVVSPGADWPRALDPEVAVFVQDKQLGTAHATLAAEAAFTSDVEAIVVLFGDTPLVRAETVDRMLARVQGGADIAVLAFDAADPTGYGRILREPSGHLIAIREEKDASEDEKRVTVCNSGIMAIRAGEPLAALKAIGNDNAKGEHYLTDLVAIGHERGFNMVVEMADEPEVMGVNDRAQLAEAEQRFQQRARRAALVHATLLAPETVFFSHDTVIGEDVVVEPNVVFGEGVRVDKGATVRAFSHLEGCVVGTGAVVGPFARLRPGTVLGASAKVGNFVEVKNAEVGDGGKINHLSYVGDAKVGAKANIGAGTITCNYDGKNKFKTVIEAGAFIGSNSALVAPVTVGRQAFVGTGSVITEDVPDEALAIARGRQVNKPGRSPTATPKDGKDEGAL